jgi:CBS domain-containing protein
MKVENLLLVESAMKFMPWTVQPSDSVAHARALLDEHRIDHLPVLSKGHLVGIVSTQDLQASKLPRRGPAIDFSLETHPDRVRVSSVMTTNVYITKPSDTLGDAAGMMRREHVGALPVIEEAHLRGIITRSDIIAAFLAIGPNTTMKPPVLQERRTVDSHTVSTLRTLAEYLRKSSRRSSSRSNCTRSVQNWTSSKRSSGRPSYKA